MEKSKKERVGKLLKEKVNKEFFMKHYISFNRAVSTYGALKRLYEDTERELDFFEGYKNSFFKFYGIGRFVSNSFIDNYYNKMLYLRKAKVKECDIKTLTNELIDKEKDKIQFSFTTKLLNIINDEKYPIYDSNVAKAFGFSAVYGDITQYIEQYNVITETYKSLLGDCTNIIGTFRKIFHQSKDLSDMRILDIIVWKIGEEIVKNKQPI